MQLDTSQPNLRCDGVCTPALRTTAPKLQDEPCEQIGMMEWRSWCQPTFIQRAVEPASLRQLRDAVNSVALVDLGLGIMVGFISVWGAVARTASSPTVSPATGRYRSRQKPTAHGDHTEISSQVGGKSVINYSYTDMPWRLVVYDIYYFFRFSWALPWILWPFRPCDGGHFNELSFTWANMFCVSIHAILVILQLLFILSLPLVILLPVWLAGIGMMLFMSMNWVLCRLLNGPDLVYYSDPKYSPNQDKHANEKWVFLNGVAVGKSWMISNINRLAFTFQRPVMGIHNTTSGIIFDVLECLVQRNFSYATRDVREAYKTLKDCLYDAHYTKVVFIMHSQGGIEGGLVLDWLLQELPQDLLAKLEVYTFGCAANHFNNPHRRVNAQETEKSYLSSLVTRSTGMTDALTESPVEIKAPARPSDRELEASQQFHTHTNGSAHSSQVSSTSNSLPDASFAQLPSQRPSDRAIGHIEHYAHTTDFVALWGVLHFVTNGRSSPSLPRFIGRVFSRTSPRGGHQFCQHYLDGMFPLERDSKGNFLRCKDTNEFMESVVSWTAEGTEYQDSKNGLHNNWAMIEMAGKEGSRRGTKEVAVHGSFTEGTFPEDGKVRVRHLSRLWLYRNGGSPQYIPPSLERGADGVLRAGTAKW